MATGQSGQVLPSLAQLEAAARQDSLDPESHYSLALRYDSLKRYDDDATRSTSIPRNRPCATISA